MDYQKTQSGNLLASHSNASSLNMETMAFEMNDLARKTKTDSTSMKVITVVTLAFLPATFVSVSAEQNPQRSLTMSLLIDRGVLTCLEDPHEYCNLSDERFRTIVA